MDMVMICIRNGKQQALFNIVDSQRIQRENVDVAWADPKQYGGNNMEVERSRREKRDGID